MRMRRMDQAELEKVFSKDPVMEKLYQRYGVPRRDRSEDIFNDLVRSIIGQQLSVRVARSIYGKFIALFDDIPQPMEVIEIDKEELRRAGLSYQKASYIKNVAIFFKENRLEKKNWEGMKDEEIIELLSQIKGVGKWTVQMLLMFSFDRPDVFPIDDLGIRQGMKAFYQVKSEGKDLRKELIDIAENWRPYRTLGSKLIWIGKDNL